MTTILSGILHLPCGFPLCLLGWFLFLGLIPAHHCSLSRSWLLLVLGLGSFSSSLSVSWPCTPVSPVASAFSSPVQVCPWSSRLIYSVALKKKIILTYSFFLILSFSRCTLLLLGEDSKQARKRDFTRYGICQHLNLRSPRILRNICWLFEPGPYKCFHWRNSYLIPGIYGYVD